jgi:Holliday junction resolvasome RuvABC DNA-binding subunit
MLTRLKGRVSVMTAPSNPDAHLIEVEQSERAYTLRTSKMTEAHILDCAIIEVHVSIQHNQQEGSRMFGFTDLEERDMFNRLVSLDKVGPERALALLSAFSPDDLWAFANDGDPKWFVSVKGIGPGNAKAIIDGLKAMAKKFAR